jgi:hypothetical protein
VAGSYAFVITATDPKGKSVRQSFTLKVSNSK